MPPGFVVDTNVAIVANGKSGAVAASCELRCIDALEGARRGIVYIDALGRILEEYRRNLSASGQPGLGDAFFKWVWDRQAAPDYCRQISLTPRAGDGEDYEEFPRDPELASFDPSDRKFAAVALASGAEPEILDATDSDWWVFQTVLARHGIRIRFICPETFKRASRQSGVRPARQLRGRRK